MMPIPIRWAILVALSLSAAACDSTAVPPSDAGAVDARDASSDAIDASDAATDGPSATDDSAAPGRMPVALPGCAPNRAAVPQRPPVDAVATLPPLRVEGRRLVDPGGRAVALRGTNFGAWMLAESWLSAYGRQPGPTECTTTHSPCFHDLLVGDWERDAERRGIGAIFRRARATNLIAWLALSRPRWPLVQAWRDVMWAQADAQRPQVAAFWEAVDRAPWVFEEESLWDLLARRFGADRAERLRAAHQDHFVTEVDVRRVAAAGLNLIRVPFWYANLEDDRDGAARFRAEGFARLDRLARWARTHRLYLMLDMHGAPGGQSHYDHQGLRNGGSLWTRPECVDRAATLWRALATYFRGDPHVLAYDLLNEPDPDDVRAYERVHTELYRAIRSVDADHIVVLEEGYQGPSGVRSPGEMGFTQTIFQVHEYPQWTSPAGLAAQLLGSLARFGTERFDVPIYLGEFAAEATGPDGSSAALPLRVEAMDRAMRALNGAGYHWSQWTWKTGGRSDSTWGLYHPPSAAWVDLGADVDAIERDFRATQSDGWVPVESFLGVVRARAADPVVER